MEHVSVRQHRRSARSMWMAHLELDRFRQGESKMVPADKALLMLCGTRM